MRYGFLTFCQSMRITEDIDRISFLFNFVVLIIMVNIYLNIRNETFFQT